MKPLRTYLRRMAPKAHCPPRKPMKKIVWSTIGAFVGIYLIAIASRYATTLGLADQMFLIGSFGASAVLTYGAPLAEFSQPRNLVLGHVLSAIVGVTTFKLMPHGEEIAVAAALAVAFAIAAMHLTRSLHPPGGATALIAVIGSDRVHALGYEYVLVPVLIGAAILLVVALAINNLSTNPQRHYPVYWY